MTIAARIVEQQLIWRSRSRYSSMKIVEVHKVSRSTAKSVGTIWCLEPILQQQARKVRASAGPTRKARPDVMRLTAFALSPAAPAFYSSRNQPSRSACPNLTRASRQSACVWCDSISHRIHLVRDSTRAMPPKRTHDEAQPASLKEKLQHLQGTNARGRRNGGANTINGSGLKEVDNASTNSGQTSSDLSSSNVS